MSTRSRIGQITPADSIVSVYCHSDGYLEGPHGVGHVLLKHYKTAAKITALIALGDLSSLGKELAPPTGVAHSFSQRAPDVTVAYDRDRGDPGMGVETSANQETFLAIDSGQEYSYLWNGKTWSAWSHDGGAPRALGSLKTAQVTERLDA